MSNIEVSLPSQGIDQGDIALDDGRSVFQQLFRR